jgi:hypothetical protein
MADYARRTSSAPLLLMLAGVLVGLVGFTFQFQGWMMLGIGLEVMGAVVAIAGMLLALLRP